MLIFIFMLMAVMVMVAMIMMEIQNLLFHRNDEIVYDNSECDDLEGRFLRSTTSVHSFITLTANSKSQDRPHHIS